MTTTYTRLKEHLEAHIYKRGQYKGDAPADYSRRASNSFRVRKFVSGDAFGVKKHNANLITAYPNGDIVLHCDGWGKSVTTGQAMHYALRKFGTAPMGFGSGKFMGLSQLFLSLPAGRVVYYDGIRLSASAEVISELRQFKRKQIDKAQVKALNEGMDESGFKAMFKILHATAKVEDYEGVRTRASVEDVITNSFHSNHWAWVVADNAYMSNSYSSSNYRWQPKSKEKSTAPETWARIMSKVKKGMYETLETEFTKL